MSEDTPTCQIHQKYHNFQCTLPAIPADPDGLCILHSHDPAKDPAAFRADLLQIWNKEDSESYDFSGVFFPGKFYPEDFFGTREFPKPVNFSLATFSEGADFSGATLTEVANFYGATFTKGADFLKATFMKEASFSGANFTKEADFSGAIFKVWADFSGANFMQKADFSEATFSEANFTGATFNESASFYQATFKEGAAFSGANFSKEAFFSGATFTKGAYFHGAIFTEGAGFSGATFTQAAYFLEATFTKESIFIKATFREWAAFSRAKIAGRLVLRNINPPNGGKAPPPFNAYFLDLQFQDQGLLRFQDLSLAQAQFAGTDLRRVEFHHVAWHDYRGHQAIYEEILLREEEKKNPWLWKWFRSSFCAWLAFYCPYVRPPETPWGDRYGTVERLYRYLKINYEGEHDYKNAGDFHYGEMEMHRRASKWRWFPGYWYNLYRWLSGYGERPSWALGWLALFIAGFTGLLALTGLDPVPPHQPAFGDAFFYLLQKATLQRPEWANPLSFWGKLGAGFSVFLIPGQAALFLLALRNRLGRRR